MCSLISFSTTHYIMLLILLWQFTNSLLYYYLFHEPAYVSMMMDAVSSTEVILVEAILSSLSIVAGI